MIESEGQPHNDAKVSRDSWLNHLKRNQSVIVDLMHGLYKSTVHCPDCDRVSVTFEPYMNINLPIPEVKLLHRHFFWVPFDTSKRCVLHSFSVRGHRQIRHLKKQIGHVFGVSAKSFELVLIFDSRIQKILPSREPIASLLNNNHASTLFAFEVKPSSLKRKYRDGDSSNSGQEQGTLGKRINNERVDEQQFSIDGYSSDDSEIHSDELG